MFCVRFIKTLSLSFSQISKALLSFLFHPSCCFEKGCPLPSLEGCLLTSFSMQITITPLNSAASPPTTPLTQSEIEIPPQVGMGIPRI
jgi:hypothetical protein